MRKLLSAVILSALLPAAAHAADFNGRRLQILGGWDSVSYENKSHGVDKDLSDAAFGIASGYDFQVAPTAIFGIGASTILSSVSGTRTNGADTYKVKVKRDIELTARTGIIVDDAALLYVKAGYANTKVKVKTNIAGVADSYHDNGGGFRAGVGVEFAISGPVAGVLEYRYTTYGNGFTRNQILAGVGFRF